MPQHLPVHCQDCDTSFLLSPDGMTQGAACANCGGTRLERDQPSPTNSDGDLRNMVDPATQLDQGGNPSQEGIWATTDGGWQNFQKRDESFASVHEAAIKCPHCEIGVLTDKGRCPECNYSYDEVRDRRLLDHPDPWMDNEPGTLTLPEHWGKTANDFNFDFGGGKTPTHKFIVDQQGQVYSHPNPIDHAGIAEANGLIEQGFPKRMSLGELNDDNSTDWYQHDTSHSPAALASMLYGHFGHDVSIDPNLKPTTNEERWGLPSNPGWSEPMNDQHVQDVNRLRDENPTHFNNMNLELLRRKDKPFGYYDNPYINRGGSVDRTLNMDPYMPWTHEAEVKTADEPVQEQVAPEVAPIDGPQHHATVTPGPAGIHAGTVKWLQFLDAQVNGLKARGDHNEIMMRHGMPNSPEFGQPVQVSVHDPSHLPGAINTIETSAQGSVPAPLLKELAMGIAQGRHPAPPGIDPTQLRFGKIAAALLGEVAAPLLESAAPWLMRGALMHGGGELAGGLMGGGGSSAAPQQQVAPPQPRDLSQLASTHEADLETPLSNPGYYHDDPESIDQHEFNDGDHTPNPNNPNMDDSGVSGEDNTPSFGQNSPGMERLKLLAPLVMHYHNSEDSGENDPLIHALHQQLDQENPGYLDRVGPEHEEAGRQLLDHLRQPDVVHASLKEAIGPGAGYQQMAYPAQVPQGGPQPTGQGHCPYCGGVTLADGTCPQCGGKAQNSVGGGIPQQGQMGQVPNAFGTMPTPISRTAADHQGPVTDEQKAAVSQLLISQHRQDEIPNMLQQPWDYAKELASITGQQPAPNVDPSEQPPTPPAPAQEVAPPGATMPVPNPADPSAPTPYTGKVATPVNGAPRCPKCNSSTTGFHSDGKGEVQANCHSCGNIWNVDADIAKTAEHEHENPLGVPAADQDHPHDVEQEQDSSHTWQTPDGDPLQVGQKYEVHNPTYAIPDIVRIDAIKPESIVVTTIGEYSNTDDGSKPLEYQHEIPREEAQLEHLTFVPSDGSQGDPSDPVQAQPDQGAPQAPVNTEPVTAVGDGAGIHSHVSATEEAPEVDDSKCPRCASDHITSSLSSATTSFHECYRCAHSWETKEEDFSDPNVERRSWVMEDDGNGDDFFSEMERHKASRQQVGSRNLSDIAARDSRLQEIKSRLDQNAVEHTAGKKFTPREQREFIDEQGVARNADKLELEGTHYESHRYVGDKANGMNAPDSHLFLGL